MVVIQLWLAGILCLFVTESGTLKPDGKDHVYPSFKYLSYISVTPANLFLHQF